MKRQRRSFGKTAGIDPSLDRIEIWSALKSDKWLRILLRFGVVLLAATYVVIHFVLLPAEEFLPSIIFQSYSNDPSGEQFAVVAVTNYYSYPITFSGRFMADLEKTNCFYTIHSSLENQTIAPGGSYIGSLQVPPHPDRWTVVTFVKRHTFMERSFGWLLRTNRFVEVVESGWLPK